MASSNALRVAIQQPGQEAGVAAAASDTTIDNDGILACWWDPAPRPR